jgi:threonine dehydratase
VAVVSASTFRDLVTLDDIADARRRIAHLALHTPLVPLPHPEDADDRLWCKAESLQPTASFKVRGAGNRIIQVQAEARERGILAQSSGNHARAVAWVARQLGLTATIVMPANAPASKIAAVRELGAEIELVPAAERDARAAQLVHERGAVHVPPFDHPQIIAGQGTLALEILEDLPDVAAVLVPVSGGGLIAGVATAVKALKPGTRVIGVEPELAGDAAESFRTGRRVRWASEDVQRTVADGLRVDVVGEHTWPHIEAYVDDVVTVTEDQILSAMRHLALAGRLVAEPSGAVATAAWLFGLRNVLDGPVAAVVSGGSVEPGRLAEVLLQA